MKWLREGERTAEEKDHKIDTSLGNSLFARTRHRLATAGKRQRLEGGQIVAFILMTSC